MGIKTTFKFSNSIHGPMQIASNDGVFSILLSLKCYDVILKVSFQTPVTYFSIGERLAGAF